MKIIKEHFVKCAEKEEECFKELVIQYNWKKAIEKMCVHARSDIHIQSCEAEMVAARQGTNIQQLQHVHVSEEGKVKTE